ncbi:MAG: hypothetical protein NTW35_00305 [Candidatus Nomurabacteria bacterium]|nr:hypothetical protein [Candidatus Nomurabacteria bacterium]
MKTTIVLLSVLIIGVSVGFYLDHSSLIKKTKALNSDISTMKAAYAKQTTEIKTILSCVNLTEKAYTEAKQYSSAKACIKTRLSAQE